MRYLKKHDVHRGPSPVPMVLYGRLCPAWERLGNVAPPGYCSKKQRNANFVVRTMKHITESLDAGRQTDPAIRHGIFMGIFILARSQFSSGSPPGSYRFPNFLCPSIMMLSSSSVHIPRLMSGLRWWIQRSRHCLPLRPEPACRPIWMLKSSAVRLQFLAPFFSTTLRIRIRHSIIAHAALWPVFYISHPRLKHGVLLGSPAAFQDSLLLILLLHGC